MRQGELPTEVQEVADILVGYVSTKEMPSGLMDAFRASDLMQNDVGLQIACHFVNRRWHRPSTGEEFSCSFRWIAGLLAKERNRIVEDVKRGPIGDIFGLYTEYEPEIYIDWYFHLSLVSDEDLDVEFLRRAASHGWEPQPQSDVSGQVR